MPDLLSIKGTYDRLRSDHLPVSESALRRWVKNGDLPCRWIGTKALLFYPSVLQFLQGSTPVNPAEMDSGIVRRVSI